MKKCLIFSLDYKLSKHSTTPIEEDDDNEGEGWKRVREKGGGERRHENIKAARERR